MTHDHDKSPKLFNNNISKDDDTKDCDYYKRILTTAARLETIQSNLESVIDYFVNPVVKLYSRLCNDSLKLLLDSEFKLDHYRKVEEIIWRRIYHDVYRFYKHKKQQHETEKKVDAKKPEQCLLESHFISGIGFYSSLIIKLRYRYKVYDAHGVIEPLNAALGPIDNFLFCQDLSDDGSRDSQNDKASMLVDDEDIAIIEWARQAIYRSLVYMGDLARYLLETSQFDYRNQAFKFYLSASRNQPECGLPYNQLATLASSSNINLDAVCNYMRCCLKPKPFKGAESNMRKLFDLNRKLYEDLKNTDNVVHAFKISQVLSSKEPSRAAESMVRAIIIAFIKLTSDLWLAASDRKFEKDSILNETQRFFENLRESLELEPIIPLATLNSSLQDDEFCPISSGSSSMESPRFISPTIMYEFCSISIMLLTKCQIYQQQTALDNSSQSLNDCLTDLVHTLALNLLHYSTAKCQKMILNKLKELRVAKINCRLDRNISLQNSRGNLSNYSQKSEERIDLGGFSDASSNKRVLSRLRQRKAATNYLVSMPQTTNKSKPIAIHPNEDSDMSELEETALSTIDALDISSGMSDDNFDSSNQMNDLINLDSSSDDTSYDFARRASSIIGSEYKSKLSRPVLRPTKSQTYEIDRSRTMFDSAPNSLPIPDLLTGDLLLSTATNHQLTSTTSQSPMEFLLDSDLKAIGDENTPNSSDGCQFDSNVNEFTTTMAFIYSKTYLPTIKIFCDWLLSNGNIIDLNLPSFQSFHNELEELVRYLKDLRTLADKRDESYTTKITTVSTVGQDVAALSNLSTSNQEEISQIYTHIFDGPAWIQKYPLSCDHPLHNLSPLKNVHESNIDFKYSTDLDDSESGFVTIQCIEAFCYALTAFLENKVSS